MSELDCKSATFGEVKLTCTNFDSDWGACGSCQSCKSRLLIASYQARIEELEAALRKIEALDPGGETGTMSTGALAGLIYNMASTAQEVLQENTDVG